MTNRNQGVIGLFIVFAGLIILLGKLGVFSFIGHIFWPLAILLPGIILQLMYFSRSAPAIVLIPAGILTVYGALFFLCNTWGWWLMGHLWPVLILGVAVGLYEYYVCAASPVSRNVGFASIALTCLSGILLIFSLLGNFAFYFIALLLILSGLWILASRSNSKTGW
ncbi:hypothetical protein ACFSGI_05915 [Paenibacillus nicotianae]|uniref:DUF5668 domain-containing protein n=1 Tax=Paenibacillus nicotianae TaxID=1526551 RepID=A0ABW4USU0_9BACL